MGSIKLNGKNKIDEFCLEPTTFQVLEDKLTKAGVVTEAVNTKVTTRQTYVLTGIEGDLITKDGKLTFIEKDGIDYAPTTVQLPGGERVPFLFTVKNLVAKADGSPSSIDPGLKLAGNFKVPSYRTGLFLDPKGGSIELKVTDVNEELGEIGGVFVHKQPSDTDLGSKAPKELLLKGNWFATVQ